MGLCAQGCHFSHTENGFFSPSVVVGGLVCSKEGKQTWGVHAQKFLPFPQALSLFSLIVKPLTIDPIIYLLFPISVKYKISEDLAGLMYGEVCHR